MRRCVRVYPNQEQVTVALPDNKVAEWLACNERFRFGCALFVDGQCKYPGYLTKKAVATIETNLQGTPAKTEELSLVCCGS